VVGTPSSTGFTWTDGTANWNTAGDWSGGAVPTPVADVTIGSGAGGTVTLSQDSTINSLTIGAGSSTSYTLSVSGGDTLTVAKSATSVTVNSGGTISLGGSLNTLGTVTVASGGALDLSGGTQLVMEVQLQDAFKAFAESKTLWRKSYGNGTKLTPVVAWIRYRSSRMRLYTG